MVKTLTAIGHSLGLIIDRPILELLGITRETELRITTDGKKLIVEPLPEGHHDRVMESARRVTRKHERTLRKLAE